MVVIVHYLPCVDYLNVLCGEHGWRSGKALTSHHCDSGSIPVFAVSCGARLKREIAKSRNDEMAK